MNVVKEYKKRQERAELVETTIGVMCFIWASGCILITIQCSIIFALTLSLIMFLGN